MTGASSSIPAGVGYPVYLPLHGCTAGRHNNLEPVCCGANRVLRTDRTGRTKAIADRQ